MLSCKLPAVNSDMPTKNNLSLSVNNNYKKKCVVLESQYLFCIGIQKCN